LCLGDDNCFLLGCASVDVHCQKSCARFEWDLACEWDHEGQFTHQKGSVRFAIIGDTGSGTEKQQQIADMMVRYKRCFHSNLF
jgi:hypothetical protein